MFIEQSVVLEASCEIGQDFDRVEIPCLVGVYSRDGLSVVQFKTGVTETTFGGPDRGGNIRVMFMSTARNPEPTRVDGNCSVDKDLMMVKCSVRLTTSTYHFIARF